MSRGLFINPKEKNFCRSAGEPAAMIRFLDSGRPVIRERERESLDLDGLGSAQCDSAKARVVARFRLIPASAIKAVVRCTKFISVHHCASLLLFRSKAGASGRPAVRLYYYFVHYLGKKNHSMCSTY